MEVPASARVADMDTTKNSGLPATGPQPVIGPRAAPLETCSGEIQVRGRERPRAEPDGARTTTFTFVRMRALAPHDVRTWREVDGA